MTELYYNGCGAIGAAVDPYPTLQINRDSPGNFSYDGQERTT